MSVWTTTGSRWRDPARPSQGKTCETEAAELALRAGVSPGELGSLNVRTPVTPLPMAVMAAYSDIDEGTV